jgi:hypothetical protein
MNVIVDYPKAEIAPGGAEIAADGGRWLEQRRGEDQRRRRDRWRVGGGDVATRSRLQMRRGHGALQMRSGGGGRGGDEVRGGDEITGGVEIADSTNGGG